MTIQNIKDYYYSMDDMLKLCEFNFKACNLDDFYINPLLEGNGNCYTFNGRGINKNSTNFKIKSLSTANGRSSGLTLELFLGDPDIETTCFASDGIHISRFNRPGWGRD